MDTRRLHAARQEVPPVAAEEERRELHRRTEHTAGVYQAAKRRMGAHDRRHDGGTLRGQVPYKSHRHKDDKDERLFLRPHTRQGVQGQGQGEVRPTLEDARRRLLEREPRRGADKKRRFHGHVHQQPYQHARLQVPAVRPQGPHRELCGDGHPEAPQQGGHRPHQHHDKLKLHRRRAYQAKRPDHGQPQSPPLPLRLLRPGLAGPRWTR